MALAAATRKTIEEGLSRLEEFNTSFADLGQKNVQECLETVVRVIRKASQHKGLSGESKSELQYWEGKALERGSAEYSPEAEAILSKAVKFDQTNVGAWNSLANCFWKKKDLTSAKNCLVSALALGTNPETLRNLAMVVKNLGEGSERDKSIAASVQYAKDAVALDFQDGRSWYVLGNAYVTQYFATSPDPATISRALKAYATAEKSKRHSASNNPDLFFNRANVFKLFENYSEAIANYSMACKLDPSLTEIAQEEIDSISQYVRKTGSLIASKGQLKEKRLEAISKALPAASDSRDSKVVSLSELISTEFFSATNPNKGKTIIVKVIGALSQISERSDLPVSFAVIDQSTTVVCLSLYNVASTLREQIKANDVLYIKSPQLVSVKLHDAGYKCVQVQNFQNVAVNGHKVPRELSAAPKVGGSSR